MQKITREDLKQLFKKVKKLRLPNDLEQRDFASLNYLGWIDESDKICYLVYKYKGKLTGLRFNFIRSVFKPLQKGFCELCHKHRRKSDVLFISTKTKKLPKGINYRTRGTYICSDFNKCNQDMKDSKTIVELFYRILEEE